MSKAAKLARCSFWGWRGGARMSGGKANVVYIAPVNIRMLYALLSGLSKPRYTIWKTDRGFVAFVATRGPQVAQASHSGLRLPARRIRSR